ncbi:MAG: hypothetical protein KAT32_02270 [Candidatus Moranbacteria bacterium]|nr:hypothetical protein [Candidatus Moranbacteria bacterium]
MIFTCFVREGSWSLKVKWSDKIIEPGHILNTTEIPFIDVLFDYPVINDFLGSQPYVLHCFKSYGYKKILKEMDKYRLISYTNKPTIMTIYIYLLT